LDLVEYWHTCTDVDCFTIRGSSMALLVDSTIQKLSKMQVFVP